MPGPLVLLSADPACRPCVAPRRKGESAEARQERLAAEQELAQSLEEEDGDDF